MIQNRTKLIATVGPACIKMSTLKKMVNAGVNAFRVNMSHGSQKDKKEIIRQLKLIWLALKFVYEKHSTNLKLKTEKRS